MKGKIKEKREFMVFVQKYVEFLKNNYAESASSSGTSEVKEQMYNDFCNSLTIKPGKVYIRVIARSCAHSFIVMEDNPALKLKRGDILRAATSTKPAINFAHGNILIDKYNSITWAGI